MESNWIVKGFKVSEHGEPGLLEVGVVLELGPFMLQWPEESFGNGIIGNRILNYRLTPLLFSGFLLESEHGAGSRARVVAGAGG